MRHHASAAKHRSKPNCAKRRHTAIVANRTGESIDVRRSAPPRAAAGAGTARVARTHSGRCPLSGLRAFRSGGVGPLPQGRSTEVGAKGTMGTTDRSISRYAIHGSSSAAEAQDTRLAGRLRQATRSGHRATVSLPAEREVHRRTCSTCASTRQVGVVDKRYRRILKGTAASGQWATPQCA